MRPPEQQHRQVAQVAKSSKLGRGCQGTLSGFKWPGSSLHQGLGLFCPIASSRAQVLIEHTLCSAKKNLNSVFFVFFFQNLKTRCFSLTRRSRCSSSVGCKPKGFLLGVPGRWFHAIGFGILRWFLSKSVPMPHDASR